jgi:fructokinase
MGLRRLGQPAAFLGGVSRGFLGERLLRALEAEGIRHDCLQLQDAPTTLSLVGLNSSGVANYSFYGAGCADRLAEPAAQTGALAPLPADTLALHVGSYTMVVEPVASVQRALIERERDRRVVAYDPNVRLNVEPDLDRWRDTLDWMAARCHLLKVSDEDLGLLYPGQAPAALARRWRAAGVVAVIVTRGGEGALAWTAAGELRVAPVPVAVVDTVGAGDTFQAALLAALAEHDALSPSALRALPIGTWQQVLDFAAQAAAITCSRRGADLPRRAELA